MTKKVIEIDVGDLPPSFVDQYMEQVTTVLNLPKLTLWEKIKWEIKSFLRYGYF